MEKFKVGDKVVTLMQWNRDTLPEDREVFLVIPKCAFLEKKEWVLPTSGVALKTKNRFTGEVYITWADEADLELVWEGAHV